MDYTVRIASFSDLEQVSLVEKATMGDYTYVDSAWNYFFHSEGAFLCAYIEDVLVGIAHVAVFADRSCWFEALRVHPDHQNQGVGKALYEKALELVTERYHGVSFAMYTGPKNLRSSGLAARYGLDHIYPFREYRYPVNGQKPDHGFSCIGWREAEKLFLAVKDEYHDYFSINRTMLHINEENLRYLADCGFVYADKEGNAVCCGNRFQPEKQLFVSLIRGDRKKCLDFAASLAAVRSVPALTFTFAAENIELEKALEDYGFVFVADLIIRERIF